MVMQPSIVEPVRDIEPIKCDEPDDLLIVAASWEERCLGVVRRLQNYRAKRILVTVYDGPSALRASHIAELKDRLGQLGDLRFIDALHRDPLPNVRELMTHIPGKSDCATARVTVDISTVTRKHCLQLLQGLDVHGVLNRCRLFHTEPVDYDTRDNESVAEGISSVKCVETFSGANAPSRDSVLLIFLGYEGQRALALWEHLEPNVTLVVVPNPPYRAEWRGRTEEQNHYLLSCIPRDHVYSSSALDPDRTVELLNSVFNAGPFSRDKYKYQIAPLGTKPQLVGLYRFWRANPRRFTVMYAAPTRYKQERATFPPGRTWLISGPGDWDAPTPGPK